MEEDQNSDSRMIRMLQGDVGSGKTLVALLTIVNVISKNAQAVIMAPTDFTSNTTLHTSLSKLWVAMKK
ncbi:MAG UNVERIFIED_CONTAM: hypothetical protein LVQ98_05025 [Rickettsiaceae bacterium]